MDEPPLASGALPQIDDQLRLLRAFWDVFDETGESGQTSWEILDGIRSEVNDCFHEGPSAIYRAISLTAKAIHLMAGGTD